MKACHIPFNIIFTYVYHQHTKHFVTTFIKYSHISENMTIWPRNSTKEKVWRNTKEPRTAYCEIFSAPLNMNRRTIILQRPKKQLNPTHASLFDLIALEIFADVDIWISGLGHCNKFKHFISCFKPMCNPVLFEIPHDL